MSKDIHVNDLDLESPTKVSPRYGYIRSDDSGHRYLVPEDLVAAFDASMALMDGADEDSDRFYDLCADFDRDYGKYRLDGGVEHLKVLMGD